MSDQSISMKPIRQIAHIAGAEPAGICLQLTTHDGDEIRVFLANDLMAGLRDMMAAAIESRPLGTEQAPDKSKMN